MTTFEGRTVFITGGGTGIGKGCAEYLLGRGATVTIAGPDADVLESAAAELRTATGSDAVRQAVCDVTDEDTVRDAVATATVDGRLDFCVANAGTGFPGPITLMDKSMWQIPYDVNVVGTALCIKHSAPAMARSDAPAIVAISSVDALRANLYMPVYSMTKAAVDSLVAAASRELGHKGIRVNGIRPGLILTDTILQTLSEEFRAHELAGTYLGRPGTPEDVARVVGFLLSPDSSFITGQMLNVCGGLSVHDGGNFHALARLIFGDEAVDKVAT
jgi:NAD(P)-dependent dehydrogenase (short-subunit alcohol dehydrogenase family)